MHFQFLFTKLKELRQKAGDSQSLMVDLSLPAGAGIKKLVSNEAEEDLLEASLMLSDSDDEEGDGGMAHVVVHSTTTPSYASDPCMQPSVTSPLYAVTHRFEIPRGPRRRG